MFGIPWHKAYAEAGADSDDLQRWGIPDAVRPIVKEVNFTQRLSIQIIKTK